MQPSDFDRQHREKASSPRVRPIVYSIAYG